jgi:uncharacterized pyridoxamine 5'-phosphate oxidase family protein
MDFNKEYYGIMDDQKEIALATCNGGNPNVRIVNFCCNGNAKGVIYFSTFGDNQKVDEFEQNPVVAFTTVPHEGNAHVRVKKGTVQRSKYTVYDLRDAFVKKIPDYDMTIEQVGEELVLFEVHFQEADVTIDLENSGSIVL